MILRGPGIPAGSVVDGQVGLIDVAPTLLSLAGLPTDRRVAGVDRSPLARGEGSPGNRSGPPRTRSFRGDNWRSAVPDARSCCSRTPLRSMTFAPTPRSRSTSVPPAWIGRPWSRSTRRRSPRSVRIGSMLLPRRPSTRPRLPVWKHSATSYQETALRQPGAESTGEPEVRESGRPGRRRCGQRRRQKALGPSHCGRPRPGVSAST